MLLIVCYSLILYGLELKSVKHTCMGKGSKRGINSVLSIFVKVLLAVLIIYKLIPFIFGDKESEPTNETTTLATDTVQAIQKDTVNLQPKPIKAVSLFEEVETVILYHGKPVEGAYFKIFNCPDCVSSISKKDGLARIKIPKKIYTQSIEYDFYVYKNDTLLYKRSMNFANLQLNKYESN